MALLPCFNSTMSPLTSERSDAVAGAMSAALSHVSFVSDFGNSCSHALFAKRPSYTLGSGRKTTSRPCPRLDAGTPAIALVWTVTVFGANAVFGITPSCSHRRQSRSNGDTAGGAAACPPRADPGGGWGAATRGAAWTADWRNTAPPLLQNARTRSYAGRGPPSLKAATISWNERPP